jgi:hypothetical protein
MCAPVPVQESELSNMFSSLATELQNALEEDKRERDVEQSGVELHDARFMGVWSLDEQSLDERSLEFMLFTERLRKAMALEREDRIPDRR